THVPLPSSLVYLACQGGQKSHVASQGHRSRAILVTGVRMAFIDEPFVKIDWDTSTQCIVADWKGVGRGAAYRAALDRSLELVRKHKASRWLGIMLEANGVMAPEDAEWLRVDWFPRLLAAGGRRFAVVLPAQALAAMQLNRIKREIDADKPDPNAFLNRYFDNVAEARAWLAQS